MAGLLDNNYGLDLSSLGNYGSNAASAAGTAASVTPGLSTAATGDWSSILKNLFSGALNKTDTASGVTQQGWAAPVIGGAAALMNGFLGMQQYGLAQDAQKEQKREFNLNYQNQRSLTNTQLEDRQRARVAAGGSGAYESVSDYMKKNGV